MLEAAKIVGALRRAGVTPVQFIRHVQPWVSASKQEKISRVSRSRLPGMVCVLEGLYDLGNIGAVARSAEAFGITQLCLINKHNDRFKKSGSRTSAGANKWMSYNHYRTTAVCFEDLRSKGFHVAVAHCTSADGAPLNTHFDTHPGTRPGTHHVAGVSPGLTDITPVDGMSPPSVRVSELAWPDKTAVVLGNEFAGMSAEAIELADSLYHIPTNGFVQSLNVSVAAAITFHEISRTFGNAAELALTDDVLAEREAEAYARLVHSRGIPLDIIINDMLATGSS